MKLIYILSYDQVIYWYLISSFIPVYFIHNDDVPLLILLK